MANGEDNIRRAVKDGDVAEALKAYLEYVKSMERSGQTPKQPSSFGIKK